MNEISNDIESHKKVCRELYLEISRVFMEKGVVSHDFALVEKLYKKTMPQTIIISRQKQLRKLNNDLISKQEEVNALKSRIMDSERKINLPEAVDLYHSHAIFHRLVDGMIDLIKKGYFEKEMLIGAAQIAISKYKRG